MGHRVKGPSGGGIQGFKEMSGEMETQSWMPAPTVSTSLLACLGLPSSRSLSLLNLPLYVSLKTFQNLEDGSGSGFLPVCLGTHSLPGN